MAKEKEKTYAIWWEHREDAARACQALFAEVYELLKKRGHVIEVEYDGKNLPQILSFNEHENGKYNKVLMFSVDSVNAMGAYRLTSNSTRKWSAAISYEPSWAVRDMGGRVKRTRRDAGRGDLSVEAVADFVEKYFSLEIQAAAKRNRKDAERILLDHNYKTHQEFLKTIDQSNTRPHFEATYNRANSVKPFLMTMFCTQEEVVKLLELINKDFPSKKLSQE